jgi:uncharacterized protein GlcG (DUF336 family)
MFPSPVPKLAAACGLCALFAGAFLPAAPAEAQVVMQRNISLPMATQIAQSTLAACKAMGFNTAVAVVDRAGQVLVLMRDDAATPQTAELARRKAYTARMYHRPTSEWAKRTRDDPETRPQRDLPDVIALGGGLPVNVGNDTIGGVGSAGANGQDKDENCARAGIAKVADMLK